MTPLEAAKALAAKGDEPVEIVWLSDSDWEYRYAFCGSKINSVGETLHRPDCPWLVMPQIVAALEAAEYVVACYEPLNVEECASQDLSGACIALAEALRGEAPS